jgi:hypothetical protein
MLTVVLCLEFFNINAALWAFITAGTMPIYLLRIMLKPVQFAWMWGAVPKSSPVGRRLRTIGSVCGTTPSIYIHNKSFGVLISVYLNGFTNK